MLSENEFLVLNQIRAGEARTQRALAEKTGLSLGNVNSIIRQLTDLGYTDSAGITAAGFKALEPHKVQNAIIMAAGKSSRFAPISYEKPKGTLRVCGEVLIERIIRQLHATGIYDITVVIGYMKEQFLYLEDAFGVSIVVNDYFAERNNNSTLKLVEHRLGNTYILTSDNYFTQNVFEPYVYHAYYAAVFDQGETEEWCLRVGAKKRITKVTPGGADSWVMFGEAYFDTVFSQAFVKILDAVYDRPETQPKLWEDIYADHIKDLDMHIKKYPDGIIYEFDSLDDVRRFDPDFITNIDSSILDNICQVLACERVDITNIAPMEKGLSNLSFYFKVGENEYVYRHPGQITQGIINRAVEAEIEVIARDLGLDASFVYQDPVDGWKLSRFVHIKEEFDYHNKEHVCAGIAMIKKLHGSQKKVDNDFDIHDETEKIKRLLKGSEQLNFPDFAELDARANKLYGLVTAQATQTVLCHCDFYEPNILVAEDQFYLIDWEYAGMSDYACDLGVFICCSDYTYDQAIEVFETYFGRPLDAAELFHCIAYTSLAAYYWFVWALNKEAADAPVGEWLYLWYRFAKEYGIHAENLLANTQ
ncbi:MAG: phosphotransferase [Coriobacteriales bacterium]|nr:phosphotransferase [Coriobacteriales bacterium]